MIVVILSGNKQEEDVETRLGAEDSRFQRILWAVNLLTDVMLFIGKLHSAHLFQIDSELVLSNATPATQESRQSWIRLEPGSRLVRAVIFPSEEACQIVW